MSNQNTPNASNYSLHENIVAIASAIYGGSRLGDWLDSSEDGATVQDQISGFPGVYRYIIEAAEAFEEAAQTLAIEWDGEWDEVVTAFAEQLIAVDGKVLDQEDLRVLAFARIEAALKAQANGEVLDRIGNEETVTKVAVLDGSDLNYFGLLDDDNAMGAAEHASQDGGRLVKVTIHSRIIGIEEV